MKCIAYIRVSTKQQDENNQRRAIEEFARKEGMELLRFFIDKGQSRMNPWRKRPGAREMVEFLEKGGKDFIDAVIVFDFTRLGASMLDILNLFNKLEKELGVRVISIHDEWLRTKDESLRKLLIALFSWMAEMELKLRRERQQAAWEAGKQKGRPPKITEDELEQYLRRYPFLSLRAITDLINAERQRKGLSPVSYYTVFRKAKKLGYRRSMIKTK